MEHHEYNREVFEKKLAKMRKYRRIGAEREADKAIAYAAARGEFMDKQNIETLRVLAKIMYITDLERRAERKELDKLMKEQHSNG